VTIRQSVPSHEDDPVGHEVEQALDRCRRGVEIDHSFRIVYLHYLPRVERFLQRLVFSPVERLDLTQEIFLKVYRGLEGYSGDAEFEHWVMRIAHNTYRTWRDHQPGGRHASREAPVDPDRLRPDPAAGGSSLNQDWARARTPLDDVMEKERRRALIEAVERLPARMRHAIALRIWRDRSIKEIAVALRISPETAKVHLFLARKKLREDLRSRYAASEARSERGERGV